MKHSFTYDSIYNDLLNVTISYEVIHEQGGLINSYIDSIQDALGQEITLSPYEMTLLEDMCHDEANKDYFNKR